MINDVLAGRYRLEEQIATGGMGTVWRAYDETLQRPVAVKMLHEALADDPAASERFRREALTAASIGHPQMANVFDYVEENGRPGIVMELVAGETLAHRVARDGRLPIAVAVAIATDVLRALEAAHDAGIIHRDIKPGNILITPNGHVKVSDFGIARSLSDSSLTATGTVMGTAHYSAPEQVRGEFATPATDIYAVGVVLYEMLTGRRPFHGDTQIAIAMARLGSDPEPPRTLRPAVPPELDAAVMRALAREPEQRFGSAAEMRAALDSTGGTVTAVGTATTVIPVSASATTEAYRPVEQATEPASAPRSVPPRWASRRLGLVLIPLFLIGLVAFWMVASFRQGGSVAGASDTPSRTTSPVVTCCVVPSLRGMSLGEAARALADRDLLLGDMKDEVYSSKIRRNEIVSTSPAAGITVAEGTAIDYVLSKGPAPQVDPDDDRRGKGKGKREEFLRTRGNR